MPGAEMNVSKADADSLHLIDQTLPRHYIMVISLGYIANRNWIL